MKYINEEEGMEYISEGGEGMECGACGGCGVCGVGVPLAFGIFIGCLIFCYNPD